MTIRVFWCNKLVMKLNIIWPSENVKAGSNEVAILIDILRATSSITTLLQIGAEWISPVVDVDEARKLAIEEDTLLMGERECVKIEGFDFGNSPVEISKSELNQSKVVFTSSNFPKTIAVSEKSPAVFVGSMLNIKAVTEAAYKYASENGFDICYIPAGGNGLPSDEDAAFVGASAKLIGEKAETSRKVQEAIELVNKNGTSRLIKESKHAHWLYEGKFHEDVEFACRENVFDIVAVYKDGKIKRYNFS